jgi:hypothetical protein
MTAPIPARATDAWRTPEQLSDREKKYLKDKKTVRRLMEMMLHNIELKLDVVEEQDDGYADDLPESSQRAHPDPCDSDGGDNNVPCDKSLDETDPSSSNGEMMSVSVESSVHDAHVERCANDTRYHANIIPGGRSARARRKPDWYRPPAQAIMPVALPLDGGGVVDEAMERESNASQVSTPSSVETDADSTATYRVKKRERDTDEDATDEIGGEDKSRKDMESAAEAIANEADASAEPRARAPFIACEDSDTSSEHGGDDSSGTCSDDGSTAQSDEVVDASTKAKANQHPRAMVDLD